MTKTKRVSGVFNPIPASKLYYPMAHTSLLLDSNNYEIVPSCRVFLTTLLYIHPVTVSSYKIFLRYQFT